MALAVSLVVHTLLILALYRAYSELAGRPLPPLQIVARDVSPRRVMIPRFATSPLAPQEADPPLESRPAARIAELPRQSAALTQRLVGREPVREIEPDRPTQDMKPILGPRRSTAAAVLPLAKVELPETVDARLVESEDSPAVASHITPLERADTYSIVRSAEASQPPPRIALRTTQDLQLHRHIGLAMLPAADAEDSHPVRRRQPAEAFAHRGITGGMPPESCAAIERGLEFLARVQLDDGRWRFDDLRGVVEVDAEPVNIRADAAATGLALLAFLGAGHDHFDGRYRWTVQDALDYLIRAQQDSGELFPESGQPTGQVTRFYGHGIATLALCEAYGMTGDRRLREPAQRALDHLAATQHPEMGGWRYLPGVNTDLSVTGWQLVALRSGQLAGLNVRPETLARIAECLEMCRADGSRPGLFRYNPWASPTDPLTRHGRQPSTVMTSVGLLMELQLGSDHSDDRLRLGAEHLLANLPQFGDSPFAAPIGTLGNPQRDTYFWYYGTQAMYYLGGESWQAWSSRLEPLLVDSQATSGRLAGSWDPLNPVRDKWADYGGRLYVTAMNLLSLEIHSRHLPLENESVPQIAERPQ